MQVLRLAHVPASGIVEPDEAVALIRYVATDEAAIGQGDRAAEEIDAAAGWSAAIGVVRLGRSAAPDQGVAQRQGATDDVDPAALAPCRIAGHDTVGQRRLSCGVNAAAKG